MDLLCRVVEDDDALEPHFARGSTLLPSGMTSISSSDDSADESADDSSDDSSDESAEKSAEESSDDSSDDVMNAEPGARMHVRMRQSHARKKRMAMIAIGELIQACPVLLESQMSRCAAALCGMMSCVQPAIRRCALETLTRICTFLPEPAVAITAAILELQHGEEDGAKCAALLLLRTLLLSSKESGRPEELFSTSLPIAIRSATDVLSIAAEEEEITSIQAECVEAACELIGAVGTVVGERFEEAFRSLAAPLLRYVQRGPTETRAAAIGCFAEVLSAFPERLRAPYADVLLRPPHIPTMLTNSSAIVRSNAAFCVAACAMSPAASACVDALTALISRSTSSAEDTTARENAAAALAALISSGRAPPARAADSARCAPVAVPSDNAIIYGCLTSLLDARNRSADVAIIVSSCARALSCPHVDSDTKRKISTSIASLKREFASSIASLPLSPSERIAVDSV